jgi:prevent-host-death family protein
MEKVIQAAEAIRRFSRVLREVREGDSYTVTSRGQPIARIIPAQPDGREATRKRLFERLEKQPALGLGRWTRDELCD